MVKNHLINIQKNAAGAQVIIAGHIDRSYL